MALVVKSPLRGLLLSPYLLGFLSFVWLGFRLFKPLQRYDFTFEKVFYAFRAATLTSVGDNFLIYKKIQNLGLKLQILISKKNVKSRWDKQKFKLNYFRITNSCSNTNPNFNERGMALVGLIVLMPALLFSSFLSLAALTVQFQKTNWVDQCRESLIKIQNKNAEFMTQLLSLNPRSKQLRVEIAIAQQQLIVAVASGQLEVIPLLKLRLQHLKQQQKALDHYQRQIIMNAKTYTENALLRTSQELKKKFNSDYFNSLGWTHISYRLAPLPRAPFSLKPNDKSLAPSYSPYVNFERRQSLALSWQTKYKWPEILNSAVGTTTISSQCRISIKEGLWRAIIQKDRL
jgi:hypothetical protein